MDTLRLLEMIDGIQRADSESILESLATSFCQALGFEHFIFIVFPPGVVHPNLLDSVGFTNHPATFREQYGESASILVDPWHAHARRTLMPVFVDEMPLPSPSNSPEKNRLLEIVHDFRIYGGFSVSARDTEGRMAQLTLSIPSDQNPDRLQHRAFMAQAMLPFLFERFMHLTRRTDQPDRVTLTERETTCLQWIAHGKTSWETGRILKISERTVVMHVNNAARKLNADNRPHLIAKAIMNRLIQF